MMTHRRPPSTGGFDSLNEYTPSAPPRLSDPSWPPPSLYPSRRAGGVDQSNQQSWPSRADEGEEEEEEEEGEEEEEEEQYVSIRRAAGGHTSLPLGRGPSVRTTPTRATSMPLRQRTDTQILSADLIRSAHRIVSVPSDREKVKTTTRIVSLASRYLNRKLGATSTTTGAMVAKYNPYPHRLQSIPRQHLSYLVRQRENGAWQATVSLVQPYVKGSWTDPQGTRPGNITVGFYPTEDGALAAARHMAPPIWAEPKKSSCCLVCRDPIKSYKTPSHCRNCGQIVCSKCSKTRWPGGILPLTYHNNEKAVRFCDSCKQITLEFRTALKQGNYERALELYDTGNVNVWTPYLIDGKREYAVHLAAEGGSLRILRWLIEDIGCPMYDADEVPLLTHLGDSVFGVATRYNKLRAMRWLIHVKRCKVSEISNMQQLWQAVEFLLDVGDNIKANKSNK